MWEDVEQAHHEQKALEKEGDRDLARQRREEYAPELAAYDRFAKVRKQLTDLRKRKTKLREKLSGSELQEAIDDIEAREKQLIESALNAYERRRER